MALINSMSLRGKLTLAACAIGFMSAVALIFRMATAPSYITVMTGVDPTKSGEITSALSSAGITGQFTGGGTQLQVPKGKEDAAITALAQQGLNSGQSQMGFADTLDKQKLGASSIQQKVAYQRGLEGEIAGAISKIEGVGTPNVRLTLPDQTAFVGSEDQPGATAAVVLGSNASVLAPGAVRGIANIVASSVPNLTAQRVTITDGSGSLVWPSGGAGGESGTKAAAEASRAQATEARINALLDQTVGANKARVQVNYDLNMDKVSQEKLAYDAKGTPISEEKGDESLKGSGSVPSGTAGTTGNVPGYSGATGSSSGNNDYKQNSEKTQYGVGKTITKTEVAAGAVNKMQVGLIVDEQLKLTPGQAESLQTMVANAAGVDSGRGDTISTTLMKFPAAEAAAGSAVPAGALGALKGVGVAIAAMMFLFFLSRYLRSRESDVLMDEPSWLKSLPRPAAQAALPVPDVESLQAMTQMQNQAAKSFASDPRKKALQEVVDTEPDRVAAHLRSWITEDGA